MGAQRVADRAGDRVGAFAQFLGDPVAGIVDEVDVVAGPADHPIRARTTVQHVGAGIAGQDIGETVARSVDVTGALQREVLDIGRQRVAHRAPDTVDALVSHLHDGVAGGVDDVGVVARAARHGVGAFPTDQDVVAQITVQRVIVRISVDDVVCSGAEQVVDEVGTLDLRHDVDPLEVRCFRYGSLFRLDRAPIPSSVRLRAKLRRRRFT